MKFQQLLRLSVPALSLLLTTACATEATDVGTEDGFRAAAAGSCLTAEADACGAQSPDGCWCDDSCEQYGDCCEDKADVCDPGNSCEGSCGAQSPDGCWCDDACAQYGDCCDDYEPLCVEPPPAPSCDGACGGQAEAGCWCDDACAEYGDCCEDKAEICDAPSDPCGGECGPDQVCEEFTIGDGTIGATIWTCVDNDPCGGECGPDQVCEEFTIGDGTIGATVWSCVDNCEPLGPCGIGEECRALPLFCAEDGTGCSAPFIWQQCFDQDAPLPCNGECAPGQQCANLAGIGEQCIGGPEPVGCEAALCPVGTICTEDETGAAQCVPNGPADLCDGFECPEGEECIVAPICNDAGICTAFPGPQCVTPLPPECAAILCMVGSTCGVDPATGEVGCIPA